MYSLSNPSRGRLQSAGAATTAGARARPQQRGHLLRRVSRRFPGSSTWLRRHRAGPPRRHPEARPKRLVFAVHMHTGPRPAQPARGHAGGARPHGGRRGHGADEPSGEVQRLQPGGARSAEPRKRCGPPLSAPAALGEPCSRPLTPGCSAAGTSLCLRCAMPAQMFQEITAMLLRAQKDDAVTAVSDPSAPPPQRRSLLAPRVSLAAARSSRCRLSSPGAARTSQAGRT